MKKIVSLLIGEIKYDGRVQKEIKTLNSKGYDISLIVHKFCNDSFSNYDYPIIAISQDEKTPTMPNIVEKFKFCFSSYKLLKKIKPDIIHCNDLTTLYGGVLYKKYNNKCKLVYDAHELYPEMFTGIRKLIWNIVERLNIKSADEIISPEVNRAKYMLNKYGLKKKIHLIENFPMKPEKIRYNYIEKKCPDTKGKVKVLYLGLLSKDRGILDMIKAMKYTSNEKILVLVGNFVNKEFEYEALEVIKNNSLESKIRILERIPNNEVINYIQSSDIGLIFYDNTNLNNYFCASNKLYEFLVSKKFIITNNYPGLLDVVEKNNLGICIEKINSKLIANALKNYNDKLINDMNEEKFLWDNQEECLIEIYK